MRSVLAIVGLLIVLTAPAQIKLNVDNVYPLLKNIKIKGLKSDDYVLPGVHFSECVTGDCAEGEGIRIVLDNFTYSTPYYTLHANVLKGRFSNGGTSFTGKVYKPEIRFENNSKTKEMVRTKPFDFTDEAGLERFYLGTGTYTAVGWDGIVTDLPSLKTTFPDAEIHKAFFNKGSISWIDVDLPPRHRFIRYTGHTFASGDFMFGKALLDNGDIYEGFFLRHSFHGPGRLTKLSGKIQQGIWQIDSLMMDVVVAFPQALLQPVLPTPTKFKISELNGLDVNSFRQSANEINTYASSDFYGEVINNQASGWGLWKTVFTNENADSRDDVIGLAYGNWKHNQLDGAGIYFTTPTAGQLSFAGNKTTFLNDFWIRTGVYKNGKIVNGNTITADYSVHGNREIPLDNVPRLSLDNMALASNPLQGCGMQMEFGYSYGYDAKPWIFKLKEGYYNNGKLSGFYFENDKEKKRSYDFLQFAAYSAYLNLTEDIIKTAESSNSFCFDAMSRYKPLFVAEMRKKLASNIAADKWANSPEGQAHKRQVELDNQRYAEQRNKDCAAEFAKIGVKGRTYIYRSSLVILESYDCEKKEYFAWRPRQGTDSYSVPPIESVKGRVGSLLDKLETSVKQYQTCPDCDGTGKVIVTTTTTRTKDLPWGYFSGIETKSIRTTTKEEVKTCGKCNGLAIVLK